MRGSLFVALVVCMTLASQGGVSAQSANPSPPVVPVGPAAPAASANQNYLLGPSDVIEVSLLGRTDFTTRQRVSEDGTIQLQYLHSIAASGRTSLQLGEDISNALEKGGFFTHPVVRVDIVSFASRYVTVLGNVATPGLVPVDRAYHLSEIIARVGGVKESGAAYVILRPRIGSERRLLISTLATGDASDDPYVSPGDKIYSPAAELFYISGQIKSPSAYGMIPNMTVRMAIARGGGLTDAGSEKRVSLTRAGNKLARVDLDSKVQPGDVIVVGERLF